VPSAFASALLEGNGRYVRRAALGSAAVYEILDDDGGDVITAEVIEAPGLPRGTTVRLLATATRAMQHIQV
jgi:hypothetical protein